jgi:hypothetical protein
LDEPKNELDEMRFSGISDALPFEYECVSFEMENLSNRHKSIKELDRGSSRNVFLSERREKERSELLKERKNGKTVLYRRK